MNCVVSSCLRSDGTTIADRMRKLARYLAPTVFSRLRSLRILRKRGSRGGCRRFGSSFQSIWSLVNFGQRKSITYSRSRHVNPANLIQINTSSRNSFDAHHPLNVCAWNAQSVTATFVDYVYDEGPQ